MKDQKLTSGRVRQKLATRQKILETTQQLLQKQAEFSLEEVAKEMHISRATIYRYFSHIDLLCAEAALSLRVKGPADFLNDVQGMSLSDSLLYVQSYFNGHAQNHETALRKYLSVVLAESVQKDKPGPLRGARRPKALEAVLQLHAQRVGEENCTKLKQIITVLSGIEPLIANKDVNGLTNEASNELLGWALRMILKGLGLDRDQSGKRA